MLEGKNPIDLLPLPSLGFLAEVLPEE